MSSRSEAEAAARMHGRLSRVTSACRKIRTHPLERPQSFTCESDGQELFDVSLRDKLLIGGAL